MRITSVRIAPNAGVGRGVFEEYRYDALGRRVWVRAHRDPYCPGADVNAMPICLSTIERFVYDGAQVLYEIRQAGSDTVSAAVLENDAGTDSNQLDQFGIVAYLHGDGIDQPLGLVRQSYMRTQALVLHRDWQGAIDFATVASGSDAGKPIDCGRPGAVTGCEVTRWPGADQAIGFQRPVSDIGIPVWWGTLVDGNRNATGVLDMRARQFDPAMGMFTQEDPIGIMGGLNIYAYGNGDAINLRDPEGTCPDGFVANPDSRGNGKTWCVAPAVLAPMVVTASAPPSYGSGWGATTLSGQPSTVFGEPGSGGTNSNQVSFLLGTVAGAYNLGDLGLKVDAATLRLTIQSNAVVLTAIGTTRVSYKSLNNVVTINKGIYDVASGAFSLIGAWNLPFHPGIIINGNAQANIYAIRTFGMNFGLYPMTP